MKLFEIFDQLTQGELSQISMGGNESGEINEKNYTRVIPHINMGLLALYKRFPIKEGRLTIKLQKDKLVYPLKSAYTLSSPTGVMPYIQDSNSDPFKEDILKIERVLLDDNTELSLNDESDELSCFTPTSSVLRVPKDLKTENLLLIYRASPVLINARDDYFDMEDTEVELPYSHLEPLLYYVASRVNNPIGMTNEFHAGNSYAAKYEKSCIELEMLNLRVDQFRQNDRFENKGWV